MQVKVLSIDQETAEEIPEGVKWLDDLCGDDIYMRQDAAYHLKTYGRAYVGGGAAPLFLLFAA